MQVNPLNIYSSKQVHLFGEFFQIYAMLDVSGRSFVDDRHAAVAKKKADLAAAKKRRSEAAEQASASAPPPRSRNVEKVFVSRHERPVTDLCYDEENGVVYSSCKDKAIVRWDVANFDKLEPITTLCGHEGAVYCVDVVPEKERIVSGGADGFLMYWERSVTSGREVPGERRGERKKVTLLKIRLARVDFVELINKLSDR